MKQWGYGRCGPNCFHPDCDCKPEYFAPASHSTMTKIELNDDEVFTLQAAVEHLRGGIPDDSESRERRADAAFRIAFKLEQIAKRAVQHS